MNFLLISSVLAAGVSSLRLTPRRHTRLHTSSSGPLSFKTHVELDELCPVTMGGDLGDRRCVMMRWKRDDDGAASDVKYEMFTSYGPRADRFMREWEAAGYEVVFLGLLRIPGIGELMPVVSRETMARLPDFHSSGPRRRSCSCPGRGLPQAILRRDGADSRVLGRQRHADGGLYSGRRREALPRRQHNLSSFGRRVLQGQIW